MIKRLIFDLDSTLIEWKNEYWENLKEVFSELHIDYSNEMCNKIIKAIDTYEEKYEYYNRENMLKQINETTNYEYDITFLNNVLKKFEKCVPDNNENVVNILEYLDKKYELVILTNWFEDVQVNRLKNFGILQFFSKVYATEKIKIKPNKESFLAAMENRTPEECIMIGDSLKIDIQGAIDVKMKAIYINPNAKKEENQKYITINNIAELKNIL